MRITKNKITLVGWNGYFHIDAMHMFFDMNNLMVPRRRGLEFDFPERVFGRAGNLNLSVRDETWRAIKREPHTTRRMRPKNAYRRFAQIYYTGYFYAPYIPVQIISSEIRFG